MDHNNILGTVLAGGKSQRFGEDKSQVKLDGKLLIDHILDEIINEFKEILIVSNNQINFKHSDCNEDNYDENGGIIKARRVVLATGGYLSEISGVNINKFWKEW